MIRLQAVSLILLFFVCISSSYSQNPGFDILTIGPSTEALGINEATTAYLLGASDIYTNPANLVFESSSNLNADYSLWIGDLTNKHLAASFKRKNSAIGFGLLASEASEFELRTRPGPSEGTFSVSYLSITGGYAYRLRNLSAGVSFHYLREELYIFNASGYAFNAGISSRWRNDKLFVSAVIQNLGKMNELDNTETKLPILFRAGLNARLWESPPGRKKTFPLSITLLSDVVVPVQEQSSNESDSYGDTYLNIALSVKTAEILTLRAGYKTGESARPLTFGTGIQINNVTANYALVPFETGFGTVHSVGISYAF